MIRIFLLAAAAVLVIVTQLSAQTIAGYVLEDSTRLPISGAIIQLIGVDRARDASAVSDSAGAFVMRPRRAGSFVVHVSHPSYVSRDSMALKISAGQVVHLELRMGRRAIPIEPIVIRTVPVGRLAEFQERARQRGGFGQFITRADIEQQPAARQATDFLRGMVGVEVVEVARQSRTNLDAPQRGSVDESMPRMSVIRMRAGTSLCEPAIFLDGIPVRQLSESGVNHLLTPQMIEGVEVYPRSAGVPPNLVTPNTCGVVAFWTRAATEESGKLTWRRIRLAAAFVLAMTGIVAVTN